ncbi:MAG: ABC transporter permease [Actinomycetota bacterium]|nr:ABC transporter permease [Actinomycetota bacterium]
MIATALPAAGGPVIPHYGTSDSCVLHNGTFCWNWFIQNWGSVFQNRLFQHLELTAIAVLIGFAIAFSLALIAHRRRWLAPPVTFVTSLLYTVPSLAAFEILTPVTGFGLLTVEIPLVAYSLLVLFTNTLAGLSGVSAEVRDAATGIGLTTRQTLTRVELPLALPTIFAGLRVATVTIISLATIAAFISDLGLGKPIFDALNEGNFNTQFIGAGGLAILLALLADGALVLVQRSLTPWATARRPV